MPDRDGRFSMQDGLAIAGVFKQLASDQAGRQTDQRVDTYAKAMLSGQKIDPQSDPNFDFKAYAEASKRVYDTISTDTKYQTERENLRKVKTENNQKDLTRLISLAEQQNADGDKEGFYQTMAQAHEYFPNQREFIEFSDDRKTAKVRRTSDGEVETVPMPKPDDMLKMAKRLSDEYIETQKKVFQRADEFNKTNAGKLEQVYSPDGKQSAFMERVADVTGGSVNVRTRVVDNKGRTLHGFDPETKQYIDSGIDWKTESAVKLPTELQKSKMDVTAKSADIQNKQLDTNIKRSEMTIKGAEAENAPEYYKARAAKESTKESDDQQKKWKNDLDLMLRPFAGSKQVSDPMTGELTDEGKTALDDAMRLVDRYQRKEELKPDEKAKVQPAMRVVDIYGKISGEIYGGYNKNQGMSWRDVK